MYNKFLEYANKSAKILNLFKLIAQLGLLGACSLIIPIVLLSDSVRIFALFSTVYFNKNEDCYSGECRFCGRRRPNVQLFLHFFLRCILIKLRTAIRGNAAFAAGGVRMYNKFLHFLCCAYQTPIERSPNDDDLQPIHNRVANTLTSGTQS